MAAIISENYQSRPFTFARNSGRELIFDIQGTEDETEVLNLLYTTSSGAYLGLARESIEAEPLGGGIWKGSVKYTRLENNDEYTFSSGGGTRHITQSLGTINSYAPPDRTAPDFQGAIGVTEDRVEGVDLPSNEFEFSETHYLSDLVVTTAYKFLLSKLCGLTFNDADFKGFSAGECALINVSGSKRGDELWQLTYKFKGSANATGLVVGDIEDIEKLGHDYLWIRYETQEDTDAESLVQRPAAVYVERVLTPFDYSELQIGV